jgi:hypothetical protein
MAYYIYKNVFIYIIGGILPYICWFISLILLNYMIYEIIYNGLNYILNSFYK